VQIKNSYFAQKNENASKSLKHKTIMINNDYHIILASKSPRRQFLLKELGLDFEVMSKDIEEDYPSHLKREEIVEYLCEHKANAFADQIMDDKTLIITADTIVWLNEKVLNKPKDFNDAVIMLKHISGNMHEVISGVCLKTIKKTLVFHVVSRVYFKQLTAEEINYYVTNFKPYDKAGAYGIQEWIGYIGIEKIEGSFYNVMGLPVARLYEELKHF
jgi:septum formation protein